MGALSPWRIHARRKLAFVRMDDATAVADADRGAGRASQLARLAREIKGREIASECAALAPHIAGKDNIVAVALSRFAIRA